MEETFSSESVSEVCLHEKCAECSNFL